MAEAKKQGAKPGEWFMIVSKFNGRCSMCRTKHYPGDEILWRKGSSPKCSPACPEEIKKGAWADSTKAQFEEMMDNAGFYGN